MEKGGRKGKGHSGCGQQPCWLEPRPDSGREGGREGGGQGRGTVSRGHGGPFAHQRPPSPTLCQLLTRWEPEETGKEDPAETAYRDACRRCLSEARGATASRGPRCSKPNCRPGHRGRGEPGAPTRVGSGLRRTLGVQGAGPALGEKQPRAWTHCPGLRDANPRGPWRPGAPRRPSGFITHLACADPGV